LNKSIAYWYRGFVAGLRAASATGPEIIAEIKKASPSKGLIQSDFQPAKLTVGFERAGAAALSILIDEEFFLGSLHPFFCALPRERKQKCLYLMRLNNKKPVGLLPIGRNLGEKLVFGATPAEAVRFSSS
jgi:Indole-3-glycerol phosphate synthase